MLPYYWRTKYKYQIRVEASQARIQESTKTNKLATQELCVYRQSISEFY